jgi:hypothetical protein
VGRLKRQPQCDDVGCFCLHAAARIAASDRKQLEQGCAARHVTGPAPSDERVRLNAAGQVESKLKTPWRGGLARRANVGACGLQATSPLWLNGVAQ